MLVRGVRGESRDVVCGGSHTEERRQAAEVKTLSFSLRSGWRTLRR